MNCYEDRTRARGALPRVDAVLHCSDRMAMGCTRRKLLEGALATAGALTVPSLGTAWARPRKVGGFVGFEPAYLKLERSGELARRERALWEIYKKCQLCPRECEVNRLAGENDVCRATDKVRVNSAGAHFGEEEPLVGENGSGTIFFSHCNLRCCFCQNWEIAHRGDGSDMSHRRLAGVMLSLQRRGCHNINLVTPSHMVPHIVRALRIAISKGLRLPLVYNTGGYDKLRTIKLLDGIVDIYMPDFKFQDGTRSHKYCAEAGDYPLVAAAAIKEMHRQVGVLRRDKRGIAYRGLLLRHLVMPHNLAGTDRFVRWVARELGRNTYVNVMAQYRPEHEASKYPELARRLTAAEWQAAMRAAKRAGLTNLDR
jgi:putative pyruvate formate lyase activating enzyme